MEELSIQSTKLLYFSKFNLLISQVEFLEVQACFGFGDCCCLKRERAFRVCCLLILESSSQNAKEETGESAGPSAEALQKSLDFELQTIE